MRRPKGLLFLLATGFITVAAALFVLQRWVSFSLIPIKQEAPRIGALAPDFELTDVDGKAVRLADFRGKSPIFLNFFASWCPACRQEAPANENLHKRRGPKGLKVLAVSVDQGPTATSDVRNFMEEFKLSFIPVLDPKHEVLDLYGVTAIPTTFLIDRKGKIVAKEVGPKNWTNSERLERLERLFD